MSKKFRRRQQLEEIGANDEIGNRVGVLHIRDSVDYRNSPMDLTDVSDRTSGDLSVLKAGLLPQVGQVKEVPGAGHVAEVEVDGKIQVFTIQNQDQDYSIVELGPAPDATPSLPSFNKISDQCQNGEESLSSPPQQQLYNMEILEPLDGISWHHTQPTHFSFQAIPGPDGKYAYHQEFFLPQDSMGCEGGPIIPYREVEEYPPPPSAETSQNHNILIQRIPSRGGRRMHEGKTGANRFDDEQKREQYKRSACDRERARMKDMNKSYSMLRDRLPSTKPSGKRMSKIDSLKLAIKYIMHLKYLLSFPPDTRIPQEIVQFDPNLEAWNRLPRGARRKDLIACSAAWNENYPIHQFSR